MRGYNEHNRLLHDWDSSSYINLTLFTLILFGFTVTAIVDDFLFSMYLEIIFSGFLVVFLPGYLLLGILNVERLGGKECIYAVASSIVLVMIAGVLLNTIGGALVSSSPPISKYPVIITLILLNVILFLLCFPDLPKIETQCSSRGVRLVAFSIVLMILGISAARYAESTGKPTIAIVFIFLVAAFTIISSFDTKSNAAPVVLYFVSLALLYHNSLVDGNLVFGDAQSELYHARLTLEHGLWNVDFPTTKNGMLWLVIFYPVLSITTGLPLDGVIVWVYPLLLALLPVTVYYTTEQLFGKKEGYIAGLLIAFIHHYYVALTSQTRTGAAIFYLAVIVLFFTSFNRSVRKPNVICFLFGFGLVTTHYGVGPIGVLILSLGVIIYTIISLLTGRKVGYYRQSLVILMTLFTGIFLIIWYQQTAGGHIFEFATRVTVGRFIQALTAGGESATAAAVASSPTEVTVQIRKIEFLIWVVAGGFGVIYELLSKRSKTDILHISMSISTCFYIGITLVATSIAVDRIYPLIMIFISPYIANIFITIFSYDRLKISKDTISVIMALILGFSLIINSGVAGLLLAESTTQPELNRKAIAESEDQQKKFKLHLRYMKNSEVSAVAWFYSYRESEKIYGSGPHRRFASYRYETKYDRRQPPGGYRILSPGSLPRNSYIYLNWYNLGSSEIITDKLGNPNKNVSVSHVTIYKIQIYDSADSNLYYVGS